ncbi:hypothetical protein JCM4814A_17470 [Streptomyces phaeofaciens JCM 4814]|uniref:Uncharacterized protein n=1 Tax=Streptomyces phaeofaciens TaxID=68254 RepID=A0A918LTY9_9ACTN|nr:hypothetical protein GCM10010226_28250 [Streptomyces phaeofaciens]
MWRFRIPRREMWRATAPGRPGGTGRGPARSGRTRYAPASVYDTRVVHGGEEWPGATARPASGFRRVWGAESRPEVLDGWRVFTRTNAGPVVRPREGFRSGTAARVQEAAVVLHPGRPQGSAKACW